MSLILDALTRSEQEKRRNPLEVGDLLTDAPTSTARAGRWKGPVIVASLVSGAVLGLAVLVVLRPSVGGDQSSASTAEQDARPAASVAKPVSPEVVPRADVVPISPAPREPAQSPVSSVDGVRPSAPENIAMRSGPSPRVTDLYASTAQERGAAADEPVSKADELVEDSPSGTDSQITESPVDIDAVLRQVRAEVDADELSLHGTPLLEDLSQQFRDRVPSLMYLRHDYNPAQRSTVLINGTTLGPGQRTRGVEVMEVLADSVILRFEGTEFRLRALNSWVNL